MRSTPSLRRRSAVAGVALAAAVAGAGYPSPVAAASVPAPSVTASRTPQPPAAEPLTDAGARAGLVSAIVRDADGRPEFVEVTAATARQALLAAAAVPGADGVAVEAPVSIAAGDPYLPQQWAHTTLRSSELPAMTSPASIIVAVLDTGVRRTHEDFASGQVLCLEGSNFTPDSGTTGCGDPHGHGTHVAGIIGATAGNGLGGAGLAPGVSILPIRVLNSYGVGNSTQAARGIVYAADKGAKVINASLGGPYSAAYDQAVSYAAAKGALVIASAGNNRTSGSPANSVNYPAASPGAVSVAATTPGNVSAAYSHFGSSVTIAAPGSGILSTYGSSNSSYVSLTGTSMAAPAVAAVAARYVESHPGATPYETTSALTATATDLETAGRDDYTGAGLVNPYALLVTGAPGPTPVTPPSSAPVQRPTIVDPSPAPVTQPPVIQPPVTQPPVTQPPVTQPPVTQPAPAAPPAPGPGAGPAPAPAPAPESDPTPTPAPAPVVAPAPVPAPAPVTAPRVPTAAAPARVVPPTVAPVPAVKPNQPVTVTATHYKPGSKVTVTQSLTTRERTAVRTTVRVPVTVRGRTVQRTVQRTTYVIKPVTRSVLLGTFTVNSKGELAGKVLPRPGAQASVLTVQGQDRGGKPVSVKTPLRIG